MTLLVAVKIPTRKLNPVRRPIEFVEKGILMIADTRLSKMRGDKLEGTVDDARKIWGVADCALAGFTGSFIVAEPAIISAHFALMDRTHRPRRIILTIIENSLKHFQVEANKKYGNVGATMLFLGLKTGAGSFRLFQFDSRKNFKREERDGVIFSGSGENEFAKRFPKEIDHFTKQWMNQLFGYRIEPKQGQYVCLPSPHGEKFEVDMVKCSMPISAVLDNIVESKNISSVGGFVQLIKFTKDGFSPIYAHVRSMETGKWRMATLPDLRSYSEIDRTRHYVPSFDIEGNVLP